ncbi:MAG: TolC family protein [Bacteroidaceae bacterium]|nr:TolC family protein [Bacteroidaceae bacterium]
MIRNMKYSLTILVAICLATVTCKAQDEDPDDTNIGIKAGYFDGSSSDNIDYSGFKLPPLEILFTNARSNPSIEMLAREEQLAKEFMKKEKADFFRTIQGRGAYTYGIMDNYGSNSNVTTPIYYQYVGSKQHYWNVGASINFTLEDIIDIHRKVKRKRLEYEKAGFVKDRAFEELKIQILTLYVAINNDLVSLKTAAENAASYRGAGMKTKSEFFTNEVNVRELAETKRWESVAVQEYQTIQTRITTNILTLEILTHTPIITNITNKINADNEN